MRTKEEILEHFDNIREWANGVLDIELQPTMTLKEHIAMLQCPSCDEPFIKSMGKTIKHFDDYTMGCQLGCRKCKTPSFAHIKISGTPMSDADSKSFSNGFMKPPMT